ncbi:MAG TPA: hypothetical protein VKA49_08120, partial [Flavitalea sp.]|nr:hypothetical protein [Flavitalea sp.]
SSILKFEGLLGDISFYKSASGFKSSQKKRGNSRSHRKRSGFQKARCACIGFYLCRIGGKIAP